MKTLLDKYKPQKISDIIGQDSAISDLINFITNYKKQKKKSALLFGSSGTGKTSSVHAIADELRLELIEVNASEFRNQERINQKLGNAIKQKSIFGRDKLILIDELDGIAGMDDRGGLQAVIRLIEETHYPIILTINEPYDNKYNSVRTKSVMIKFEKIDYRLIEGFLKKVCKNEKILIEESEISSLARRCGGNLMSLLNDVHAITDGRRIINKEDITEISYRDNAETIQNALLRIFKSTDISSINAFDNVKEELDILMLWIDENLPKEYTHPSERVNAYNFLSKADIFKKRITKNQYFRFLVYINALITAGISISKKVRYDKHIEYSQTGRLLKIFWAKQKSIKKKEIAKKIAEKTHCSLKSALRDIGYYQIIFRKNNDMAENISKELMLSPEEIEWLRK